MEHNSSNDGMNGPKVEISLEPPKATSNNQHLHMGVELQSFGSHNDISII